MNKKINAISILIVFTISIIVGFVSSGVKGKAEENGILLNGESEVFFSEDFMRWSSLPEDEKDKTLIPSMFDNVHQTIDTDTLGGTYTIDTNITDTRYSYVNEIPNNMSIKNQENTDLCWSFASAAVLETTLAKKNKKNNTNTTKVYDFSEKYLDIASTRDLKDGINEYGTTRELGSANAVETCWSALVNGQGITDEANMPFETSYIQSNVSKSVLNKNITARVNDYIKFDTVTDSNKAQIMKQMKSHIKNYGGILAGTKASGDFINNKTGAIYVNDENELPNHAIVIVGWDDNYNVDHFNENKRPSSNGAWIIKNSYGTKFFIPNDVIQQIIWNNNIQYGDTYVHDMVSSYSEITQEMIDAFMTDNNKAVLENAYKCNALSKTEGGYEAVLADNGIFYISYEDKALYKIMMGIIDAQSELGYDNIYQYNETCYTFGFPVSYTDSNSNTSVTATEAVECEIFNRTTSNKEYLNEIAVFGNAGDTFEVYVNATNSNMTANDLKKVTIDSSDASINYTGFHTIKFTTPVELTGSSYAVAIKVANQQGVIFPAELQYDNINGNTQFSNIHVENNKSFIGTSAFSGWVNPNIRDDGRQMDFTIKAYTTLGNAPTNPDTNTNTDNNNTNTNDTNTNTNDTNTNANDTNTNANNTNANNTNANNTNANNTNANNTNANNTNTGNTSRFNTVTNNNTTKQNTTKSNTTSSSSFTTSNTVTRSVKTTTASASSDVTVADKKIPQTGSNDFMVGFAITFVMGVGVILYVNYRRIKIK